MKKRRRERIEEERDTEDALSTLGISRDRYLWNDDEEDVIEKQEAKVSEYLHWEI